MNQPGTCKTCRWWKGGRCDLVDLLSGASPARFEIEVTVADDHDLETFLRTGPDFGCVHHTPAEAA